MEPIKIKTTSTEQFTPNVPTRVLTMLGIAVAETPAVPVNAAGAVYDHATTSPSIKAAQARIATAEGAVARGAVNTVKGAGSFIARGAKSLHAKVTSDDAKASRMIAGDKAMALLSSVGKKVAEVAPIKVVIDGTKEVAADAVETWNSTGRPTTITTTEVVTLDELTVGDMYKVYSPHMFCDRKGTMVCGCAPSCHMDTPDCDRCNSFEELTCEICSIEGECEVRALQIQALQHFGQSEPEKSEPSCEDINEARHSG